MTPDQEIGNYRLLDVLGEGGMGTVYLAEQIAPIRRRVALKLIKLGMDSKAVLARFEQERQALALMQHDGIAKVHDCGTNGRGQPFFVMELVKGVPLTEYCDRHRLPVPARLALMQQVCSAVTHAHQKGVVHRDLKPSNVLVSEEQGAPQIKIIDFGLAKAMGQKLVESLFTEAGQIVGTPEYMAPEQADPTNADIDTRADIYSLGVMLYELLTGQLPFTAAELRRAGVLEMQRVLREMEPPRPSTKIVSLRDSAAAIARDRYTNSSALQRTLRNDLDWVVLKALEKERSRRYDTANALSADLQRYLANEPLSAGPPSATYRLRKFVRRYRGRVVAAAAVALALAAGAVATFVQYLRAEEEAATNAALAHSERVARQSATDLAAEADRMRRIAQADSYRSKIAAADLAMRIPDAAMAQRHLDRCEPDQRRFEWRFLARRADSSTLRVQAHAGGVLDVAVSRDGTWIATIPGRAMPTMGIGVERDKPTLKIWDGETGAAIAVIELTDAAHTIALSPDNAEISLFIGAGGNLVATRELVRVSTATWLPGRATVLDKERARSASQGVAIDPSGRYLAEARVNDVRLCHLDELDDPIAVIETKSTPMDLAFTADGGWLVGVTIGGQMLAVEVATGKFTVHGVTSSGHCYCCAPSPDGSQVAVGGADGVLRILRRSDGRVLRRHLGHRDAINSLVWTREERIVSGSTDGTVRIWSGGSDHLLWEGRKVPTWSCTADSKLWFLHGQERLVELGDHGARAPRELRLPPNTVGAVMDAAHGRVLVTDKDRELRLWNPLDATFVAGSAAFQLEEHPSSVRFSGDGTCAAGITRRGSAVIVFDPMSGALLGTIAPGIEAIRAVALSDDNRAVVVGGGPFADGAAPTDENAVRVCAVSSGEVLHNLRGHRSSVTDIEVFGDSIATSSLDGTAKVWSRRTGELLADLVGHRGRVYDLVFTDDGERLITASEDATVRVWDWRNREEMLVLRDLGGWVTSIAVDGNGRLITTTVLGASTEIRAWDSLPR